MSSEAELGSVGVAFAPVAAPVTLAVVVGETSRTEGLKSK